MAGIIYPDFARSIGGAMQLRQQEQQNAFQMERMRRDDEVYAREQEAAQHVPGALSGDRDALSKIATLSPKTAMSIAPLLERMDSNQRARLKEQFEATGKAAAGILALPEADQPAAYEATYQALTQQGYKINLPPRWSPALKGQLQSYAVQVPEYLKMLGDQPQPMGGVPGGGGAAPPNRDAFVQTMTPHALEVAKATGLDPRLVIAQAALETGYGQSAPGNNYFGIKSHGRPGGQTLNTTEAGPGGMYGTRESFRTYGNPGESARDYADFLKTNGRYAPVLQAQGLDAQIEALGKSGYATDPQYAAKLRQIVQSLPPVGQQPAGREVAYGGNAAPMPQPPNGMAVPGTPAQMPGMPPGLAQGSDMPAADGSGTPLPPQAPQQEVFEINSWLAKNMPGARPMGRKGVPVRDSQGLLMVLKPDGTTGWVDVPKPQQPPSGYRPAGGGLEPIPGGPADKKATGPFAGTGMDAQAMNILLTGDPTSPEYALAHSHLSKPRTTIDDQGRPITIQPMDLSAVRKPAGAAAMPGTGSPGGGTTTALPGGGTVTVGDAVAPKGPSGPEMAKLRTARAEAEKIRAAAEDFKKEWAAASPIDRARALSGANTPLNAAYNNFALLAKGDAMFQLGVLNGPDLEIIRRTIPDPSTGKSIMTTDSDVTSSVDKVLNILNTGISATEKQLGIAPPSAAQTTPNAGQQAAPQPPAVGTVVDGYIFKGGNPADQSNWSKTQ